MDCQNNGNAWMSGTPCKPVLTRSKLNPGEPNQNQNQIETSNWQELLGIYSGLLQEETPSNGVATAAAPEEVSPTLVGQQNGCMTNNNGSSCNSYNQNYGNWSGNQENNMNSYQKNVYNTSQEAKGFSVPYWPFNTLHSPMRAETGQASASTTFQLAPATPDHRKLMQNNQHCNIQYLPTDQLSTWRSEQQKTLAASLQQDNADQISNTRSEQQETHAAPLQQGNAENFRSDFVPGMPKTPARGTAASPMENQPYLDGKSKGIDLTSTPKQSTPAKRRKHRPKVVREGKQKGTPNPTTPLSNPTIITNNENQPKKRKYVRRTNIQASTTPTENTADEIKIQEIPSASKSCRRELNFDLDEVINRNRDQINDSKTKVQDSQCRAVNNNDLASAMFQEKPQGYSSLEQQTDTSTVMHPTNKMLTGISSLLTSTSAACTPNNHTLNGIAKTLSMRNASHYQPISQYGYNILGDSLGRIVQTNSCYASTDRASPLLQSTNMFNGNGVYDQRGSKRPYQTADVLGHFELNPLNNTQWLSNQMNNNTTYYAGSSEITNQSPEKLKVSDMCDRNGARLSAFTSLGAMHGIYNSLPSQFVESIPDFYLGKVSNLKKPKKAVNQISSNHQVDQMAVGDDFLKPNAFTQVNRGEHMDNKMFYWQTESSSQKVLVPVGNWNVPFPFTKVKSLNPLEKVINLDRTSTERYAQPTQGHETEMSLSKLQAKRQTRKPKVYKRSLLSDNQSLYTKLSGAGSQDQVYLELLHEIVEQLQGLRINENSTEMMGNDRNALVPYIGHGSVVPYKDPIKRRQQRAKVKLDAESIRLWNLLMWNEGSESAENMDKHTENWWEEERKVCRGRIDSFIARMHLVQGDRRFSPWKGSVVDSVIGVFLTQNVSDHSSSSAFMSLVAKFPLPSVKEHHQNTSDVIVEEPDLQTTEPGGAMSSHDGISSKPSFYKSSTTCSGTSEQRTEDIMTGSSSGKKSKTIKEEEEEVISSQSSSNSFVYQANEEVKINSDAYSRVEDQKNVGNFHPDQNSEEHCPDRTKANTGISNGKKRTIDQEIKETFDWDSLRRQTCTSGNTKERNKNTMDSLDYEKLRNADVDEISNAIKDRGMNNMLAERIKDFLNRLVKEHGSTDLEWLRDVPPAKVKEYLLSIHGLGLKSVECVRLLTLHNVAFPVDTNVGRIAVRLGWVPLQPLPESLQLHLLELYPVLETIQKYLWPRLYKLDQKTLYELHYQMITFGKVFCTKTLPNCNACPMKAECRHFASAFASARLALPAPEERSIVSSAIVEVNDIPSSIIKPMLLPPAVDNPTEDRGPENKEPEDKGLGNNEPTVEEPKTPKHCGGESESDIEDAFYDDTDEIPSIKFNLEEFTANLKTFMQEHMETQGDISKAIVAINPMASNTTPKLKGVNRLRTEHYVYELPDNHPLLTGLDRREADDPSPYLLAIWTPGETADSIQPPKRKCDNQASGSLCQDETCFSCNSIKEANSQIVRGTLLIPCRTAMRGSFPLNGTYFQVNEIFADHASSINPIHVPRAQIWNLRRRTVYFGTSVTSIFRGLTTEEIQLCFWRGFVCVRGFEQATRLPKPLSARLHISLSKQAKIATQENKRKSSTQKEQQA